MLSAAADAHTPHMRRHARPPLWTVKMVRNYRGIRAQRLNGWAVAAGLCYFSVSFLYCEKEKEKEKEKQKQNEGGGGGGGGGVADSPVHGLVQSRSACILYAGVGGRRC